jgi:hypothetical protein
MSTPSLFHRRDPWWEVDGPAARSARRRRRAIASVAFLVSLAAVASALLAWSIELGVAGWLGVHAVLPFG